ncbi:MAG: SRPBCC family protein [Verrucomicrobia bacterium]|nr:SRPBCC family protein [Verrucomicrobiota bacterium]
MKILLFVLGGCLLLGLLIYGVGLILPAEHIAEGSRRVAAAPEAVAARVRELESQPAWRSGLQRIEVLSREAGEVVYREHGRHGPIRYRWREAAPNERFESRIDDDQLPFGGRWIITLTRAEQGTLVTIREEGVVRSPVFRTLSRFVFGHETTLRGYLDELAKSFGTGAR